MKKVYGLSVLAALTLGIILVSCKFDNPLVDQNGDDINLVRLDLPRFDARYTVRLVDLLGNYIGDATEELIFTGTDANNLINEAGRIVMKQDNPAYKGYRTAKFGMLNLNLNPNFNVNSHPVSFQINGTNNEDAEYLILPKMVRQTVSGDVTIDVTAIKITAAMKSVRAAKVVDRVSVNDANATKIVPLSGQNGGGYSFAALYKSTAKTVKKFSCTDNTSGALGDYGIYLLTESMSDAPARTKDVPAGSYFVVVEKQKQLIEGRVKINVQSAMSGIATSLAYTVKTKAGEIVCRGSVSGVLPFTATVEQLFVAAEDSQVEIELEGSTTCAVKGGSQTVKIVQNATSTVDFTVTANNQSSTNLHRCEISFVGVCSTNKQIAFYPTIRFQYSPKDSGMWEWVESRSGRMVMMLELDRDYSIRIPINNVWQQFNITTNQQKIEQMVREQPNVSKFELVNNPDRTMNLKVEYQDQEFCDLNI